ncbi:MAG: hypothetical protein MK085_10045 [Phycisphaerales bacterium]|nr:hypothetical protein [Phycisphaerales bacterium]
MTSEPVIEGGGDPSIPGRRTQRVFVIGFMAFFIASILGVLIFGNVVVARAKTSARETDVALKSLAWAVLASAAEEGRFPVKLSDLDQGPVEDARPGMFAETDLPESLAVALGDQPPLEAGRALEILVVEWPPDGTLPPILTTGGRPSGLGTLDEVNGWLVTAARKLPASEGGD